MLISSAPQAVTGEQGARLVICIQITFENIKDSLQSPKCFPDIPICSTQNSKK